MTVCKGYLKIIWRNMGQNLMYLAIVLFVTIGMASQTEKTQENIVKSKFVCKLLLGTCGAKGCLASLS